MSRRSKKGNLFEEFIANVESNEDPSPKEHSKETPKSNNVQHKKDKDKIFLKTPKTIQADKENTPSPVFKTPAKTPKRPTATPKSSKTGPTAPRSPYVIFSSAYRPKAKTLCPNGTFGDISGLTAQAWKLLSEEEKQEYKELSLKDKERFTKENDEYEKNLMLYGFGSWNRTPDQQKSLRRILEFDDE